ncbi:hypothetical protein [Streptomyces sp. NPDC001307]|uniref:hypothetical protein n=1 Tax=Streptomyces sp. NPDC001307 TaxID=3364560 RepID=UPI0036A91672
MACAPGHPFSRERAGAGEPSVPALTCGPPGSDASDAVAVIVTELAVNAVTHGRAPGWDFELRLPS